MSTDTMPAPRGLPGSDVITGADGVPRHSDRAVQCAASLVAEPDGVASTPRDAEGLRTGTTNVRMMHLLERIAARFNDVGVPLLALKGAALNLTVHERPDERPMSDLDLLIKPDHIDRAFALLEGLGALRGEPLVREDFFPRFYYETEYAAGHIYPVRIDLHVRPFRPLRYSRLVPEDALWRRAETVRIGAAHILVPCAEDMLIHLAAHAAIHGDSRAMWRRDIKLWAEAHEGRIDWDRFLSTVEEWRCPYGAASKARSVISESRAQRTSCGTCPKAVWPGAIGSRSGRRRATPIIPWPTSRSTFSALPGGAWCLRICRPCCSLARLTWPTGITGDIWRGCRAPTWLGGLRPSLHGCRCGGVGVPRSRPERAGFMEPASLRRGTSWQAS